MLDHALLGGLLVDGSGAAARVADLGIRDGRIVRVGDVTEPAADALDARGLVVAPGFIEPHTHYDAQLLWDGWATPSNVHGVTTVIGGNCGFTLAPLRAVDADYTLRMLSVVEGMTLDSLQAGVEVQWETFGEYLDALQGHVAVNVGFYVGHCALRRYVMGERAIDEEATDAELDRIEDLLHASIAAGALGLSTSRSPGQFDHERRPVPSRSASVAELLRLCRAVGEHDGTSLQATLEGVVTRFSDDEVQLLVDMASTAQRPLNWNQFLIDANDAAAADAWHQMTPSVAARRVGARVTALTLPMTAPMTQSLGSHCMLRWLPGLGALFALPIAERIEHLADPVERERLGREADSPGAGSLRWLADFGRYRVGATVSATNEGLEGRLVADIARERGDDDFSTFVAIAIADDLHTVFWPVPDEKDGLWQLRADLWRDPDVVLGGSDAGAHLDRLCGAGYPTAFLGDVLRGRRLLPLEAAVRELTAVPADFFGMRDRGRIVEGHRADLVVFDPEHIASGAPRFVDDLPAGGRRIVVDSVGVERVFVNGVVTVIDGAATRRATGLRAALRRRHHEGP